MFTEDTQNLIENNESPNIISLEQTDDFPTISDLNYGVGNCNYNIDNEINITTNDFIPTENLDVWETLDISGIQDTVTIDRDEFGIPHINATNLQDAIFAQGYVQAQDRFWQMEYQRRLSTGTLSEILGEETVEIDTAVRTLGIDDAADVAYENLNHEAKEIIDAFAAGVNAYLSNIADLPPEIEALDYQPELWQGTDTMAIAQLENYIQGTTDGRELERFNLLTQGISSDRIAELIPTNFEDETTILTSQDIAQQDFAIDPPTATEIEVRQQVETSVRQQIESFFPDVQASNNWVVSGDRTTTGMPFLASDPHLNLQAPSVFYQTEINTPELNLIGAGFPGIPGILLGRNDSIAWGETSTGVDTEDYYFLEETEDGLGYIHQGEVKPYQIREEIIEVKDGETITIEVKESIYGAVVSDLYGFEQPVAIKALGLEPANGLVEAFLEINQASNWSEFTAAVDSYNNPLSNFVYADIAGNIGYIAPGNYPIRQPGHTGEYPVLGTGEFDWLGFIPREDVPQVYNPDSGYIVTANNRQTPDNYPYQINGYFPESYRATRITELIESQEKLSLEDMQEIQFDTVSLLYRDFRPLLEQLEPSTQQGKQWQQRLLDWDGDILPNSQEASLFETWYVELTRIPSAEVGREFWDEPIYLREAVTKEQGEQAFDTALTSLGDKIPVWGDIHQAVFNPPLPELNPEGSLQVPVGGDRYTINVAPNGSLNRHSGEDFNTGFGVSYRQIIDLSNLENSLYINPPGQSGNINDINYGDQLLIWQYGEYIPMKTENYYITMRSLLQSSSS
ncbi:MAG: penicillin acylase family protein [Pleurocapsa sp.]